MKIYHIYNWIFLLSVFIFFGCADYDMNYLEDNSLNIYSRVSAGNILKDNMRLTDNSFDINDEMGFYIVPYDPDNSTPGKIEDHPYIENKAMVFNGNTWLTKSGEKLRWPGKNKTDFYGYYPYDPALNNMDPTNYRFTIQTNQRSSDNYFFSDFLWAKSAGLSPTKNVELIFEHRLSKLNVNLKSELGSLKDSDSKPLVSFLNIIPEALINLSTGQIQTDQTAYRTEIGMLQQAVTEEGYEVGYTSIIPPQVFSEESNLIRIEYKGVNYYYKTKKPITFESGNTTTFNITLTKLGITVSTTRINEWTDGGSINDNINEPAPLILDMNEIDWNKSLVHEIYDTKGILLGMITKEYLFKSGGNINAPAIVVYPMNNNGKADISKGFVAQVYNRNRNMVTNEYEVNRANVHGGAISFNESSNAFANYTASDLAPVHKVELKNNVFIAANALSIPMLITKPYYLTDVDGNQYPVVKIGYQYWTTENIKTEHYKDGSPVIHYYYNDNVSAKDLYGALYEWSAVTDPRGIAPDGWRVPSEDDWTHLYEYLTPDAGMKLKANIMWSSLTTGDNVSGFFGLPTGRRTNTGQYNQLNNYGQWWTSTSRSTADAGRLYLDYGNRAMHLVSLSKTYTQSIRLMRDH